MIHTTPLSCPSRAFEFAKRNLSKSETIFAAAAVAAGYFSGPGALVGIAIAYGSYKFKTQIANPSQKERDCARVFVQSLNTPSQRAESEPRSVLVRFQKSDPNFGRYVRGGVCSNFAFAKAFFDQMPLSVREKYQVKDLWSLAIRFGIISPEKFIEESLKSGFLVQLTSAQIPDHGDVATYFRSRQEGIGAIFDHCAFVESGDINPSKIILISREGTAPFLVKHGILTSDSCYLCDTSFLVFHRLNPAIDWDLFFSNKLILQNEKAL